MAFAATINLATLTAAQGHKIDGAGTGYSFGFALGGGGDFNNDGVSDIVVGAPSNGRIYIIYGTTGGFVTNASQIDGSNGFVLIGGSIVPQYGRSVAMAGDLNNDGYDDVLIGAPNLSTAALTSNGGAYVIYGDVGRTNGFLGIGDKRFTGELSGDAAGQSVRGIGDINNDGFTDFIIGANGVDANGSTAGAAYVVFGAASFAGGLDLATLDGSNGFELLGVTASDNAGFHVSSAGDLNGDGYDDFAIGAPQADNTGSNSGSTYVVFGQAGPYAASLNLSALDGTQGIRIDGFDSYDRSATIASAGDVNGDGLDDLLIGAPYAHAGARGGAAIIFGTTVGFGASFSVSSLNGTNGFHIIGEVGSDQAGVSVSRAGDVNGDGFQDILVGARFADPNGSNSGAAYVVFGGVSFSNVVNLSSLNGTNGFEIQGAAANHRTGQAVSAAGDVNGDGVDDLLVGAYYANNSTGAVYIIYGQEASGGFAGTTGDDTHTGLATNDTIDGQGGKDVLSGADGDDTIDGGDGNDTLNGDAGADTLEGGTGNDIVNGGSGDDVITDSSGSNKLNGGDGNDTITGASGADRLNGEGDDDSLDGGAGNDYLDGGAGVNDLLGGYGNDIYIVRSLDDRVTELANEGTDTIRSTISYALAEGDSIEVLELLTGTDIDATGNSAANTLRGNNGANILWGLGGADKLEGGGGDDLLIGGAGRDQLTGGAGADTFQILFDSVALPTLEIDTVLDYELGIDTLDFSLVDADQRAIPDAFGDQDFTLALSGFTRTAGQLYAVYTAGSDTTTVRLDVNGDGKADYQMTIKGDVLADAENWLL